MTQILGTLTDSVGNVLSGTLTFQLPITVPDDSTNPDTIYTTIPYTFDITNGVVDVEVPPTDEPGVAYKINFTATGETVSTLSFNAAVPNVASVDLSLLINTGLTTTTLDTGAYRVARNIASRPILSELFKQPSIATLELIAESSQTIYRIPKPFPGAIKVKSLSVFSTDGFADWTHNVGAIQSDGTDLDLTEESSTDNTAGGRYYELNTYSDTLSPSVMGLYIKSSPQTGADPITATISISFIEI